MTVTADPIDPTRAPEAAIPTTSVVGIAAEPVSDRARRSGRRLELRRPTRSGWITGAIGALTLVTYLWGLDRVGTANSYYTAAVKSATVSWKAFFFGSIDPGNFITVDKPPAALWVQALSGRIFGFSTWSMLVPEALAGVASVLILHRLVRRWAGNTAAHLASLALASTPVAVAMFRFNNPDAFLTLCCLGAAWALWSAIETGRTRTLVLSAALVGLAFDTKMLQALLVVPAFALVYLVAGPPRLRRRLAQLTAAMAALVVSAGWWVAAVALWPAASRPYIGSTSDNSILSLVFGYNGLSRLFGGSGSGPGGASGGGGGGFGGASGWLRMFNEANGGQISWFLPLAGAGLLAGLWATRRGPRTDRARAGWLLWGTWTLVSLAVFSLSSGIFHQYYSVQVAPAVAALAGAGAVALWKVGRSSRWLRWVVPAVVVGSAAWSVVLLSRTPTYLPWLRPTVMIGGAVAAAGLWFGAHLRHRATVVGAAALATAVLLAGPAAYSVTTVLHPPSGSIVQAGPTTSGSMSGGVAGGAPGATGAGASTSSSTTALVRYLQAHRGSATYLVAAFGSSSSAPIIIESGEAVMTIGGFNGGDPAPTLAQFKALVAEGAVRYVLVDGRGAGGGPGGAGSTSSISSWVTANGTAVDLTSSGVASGSGTLYDLSGAAA